MPQKYKILESIKKKINEQEFTIDNKLINL